MEVLVAEEDRIREDVNHTTTQQQLSDHIGEQPEFPNIVRRAVVTQPPRPLKKRWVADSKQATPPSVEKTKPLSADLSRSPKDRTADDGPMVGNTTERVKEGADVEKISEPPKDHADDSVSGVKELDKNKDIIADKSQPYQGFASSPVTQKENVVDDCVVMVPVLQEENKVESLDQVEEKLLSRKQEPSPGQKVQNVLTDQLTEKTVVEVYSKVSENDNPEAPITECLSSTKVAAIKRTAAGREASERAGRGEIAAAGREAAERAGTGEIAAAGREAAERAGTGEIAAAGRNPGGDVGNKTRRVEPPSTTGDAMSQGECENLQFLTTFRKGTVSIVVV